MKVKKRNKVKRGSLQHKILLVTETKAGRCLSIGEIAKRTGASYSHVQHTLKEFGVALHRSVALPKIPKPANRAPVGIPKDENIYRNEITILEEHDISPSPATASHFRECPRRWKHTHIDGYPDKIAPEAVKSSYVRGIISNTLNLPPLERTLENVTQTANDFWEEIEYSGDIEDLQLSNVQKKRFMKEIFAFLNSYVKNQSPKAIKIKSAEQYMKGEIEGFPISGKAPSIEEEDGEYNLTVYKTGKSVDFTPTNRGGERIAAARVLNPLRVYAEALKNKGSRIDNIKIVHLGNGKNKENIVSKNKLESSTTRLAVNEHVDTLTELSRSLASEKFPCYVSPSCSFCPHLSICPQGRKSYADKKPYLSSF